MSRLWWCSEVFVYHAMHVDEADEASPGNRCRRRSLRRGQRCVPATVYLTGTLGSNAGVQQFATNMPETFTSPTSDLGATMWTMLVFAARPEIISDGGPLDGTEPAQVSCISSPSHAIFLYSDVFVSRLVE